MDFITGLRMLHGKIVFFVVTCRLSKYDYIFNTSTSSIHRECGLKLALQIYLSIIAYQSPLNKDSVFLNLFWQELFRLQGTFFNLLLAYHTLTDGETEVGNRTIQFYLRCFQVQSQRNRFHG